MCVCVEMYEFGVDKKNCATQRKGEGGCKMTGREKGKEKGKERGKMNGKISDHSVRAKDQIKE